MIIKKEFIVFDFVNWYKYILCGAH